MAGEDKTDQPVPTPTGPSEPRRNDPSPKLPKTRKGVLHSDAIEEEPARGRRPNMPPINIIFTHRAGRTLAVPAALLHHVVQTLEAFLSGITLPEVAGLQMLHLGPPTLGSLQFPMGANFLGQGLMQFAEPLSEEWHAVSRRHAMVALSIYYDVTGHHTDELDLSVADAHWAIKLAQEGDYSERVIDLNRALLSDQAYEIQVELYGRLLSGDPPDAPGRVKLRSSVGDIERKLAKRVEGIEFKRVDDVSVTVLYKGAEHTAFLATTPRIDDRATHSPPWLVFVIWGSNRPAPLGGETVVVKADWIPVPRNIELLGPPHPHLTDANAAYFVTGARTYE